MKLLKRNTTEFQYRPLSAQVEVAQRGMHAGTYQPSYGYAVTFRGHISAPSGMANAQFFGLNAQYSHVLLMDDPKADIREGGIVEWQGNTYDVVAVSPSLNVLNVALRQRTKNNAMQSGGD